MSIQCQKIWIEQCEAAEGIRENFGLQNALDYLLGEKLFTFLLASEQDEAFAAEIPAFIEEIRCLFTSEEIREYLDRLEQTKFLAPPDPDLKADDLDEDFEEELWPGNPITGAEELLRFSRMRQLLRQ